MFICPVSTVSRTIITSVFIESYVCIRDRLASCFSAQIQPSPRSLCFCFTYIWSRNKSDTVLSCNSTDFVSGCCCYYGLHTCDVQLSCKSQTPGNEFFSLHFPIQTWNLYLFQPGPLGTIGDSSGIQPLINVHSMFYSLLFWVLTDSKKSKDLVSPVSTGIWLVYLGFFSHITTFVGNEVDESEVSGLEKQSN